VEDRRREAAFQGLGAPDFLDGESRTVARHTQDHRFPLTVQQDRIVAEHDRLFGAFITLGVVLVRPEDLAGVGRETDDLLVADRDDLP